MVFPSTWCIFEKHAILVASVLCWDALSRPLLLNSWKYPYFWFELKLILSGVDENFSLFHIYLVFRGEMGWVTHLTVVAFTSCAPWAFFVQVRGRYICILDFIKLWFFLSNFSALSHTLMLLSIVIFSSIFIMTVNVWQQHLSSSILLLSRHCTDRFNPCLCSFC